MIIRHNDGRTVKPEECLICGAIKLDQSQPMCSVCASLLRAVMRREWFIAAHEECKVGSPEDIVQAGIDLYVKEHEPINRDLTQEDRDFLKALMIRAEP